MSLRVGFQCSQSGHASSVILSIKYGSVQNLHRIVFKHCKVPFSITMKLLYPPEILLSFLHRLHPASRSCYLQRPPEFPEHCPFCVLNQEVMGITVILTWYTPPSPLPYFLTNQSVFLQQKYSQYLFLEEKSIASFVPTRGTAKEEN